MTASMRRITLALGLLAWTGQGFRKKVNPTIGDDPDEDFNNSQNYSPQPSGEFDHSGTGLQAGVSTAETAAATPPFAAASGQAGNSISAIRPEPHLVTQASYAKGTGIPSNLQAESLMAVGTTEGSAPRLWNSALFFAVAVVFGILSSLVFFVLQEKSKSGAWASYLKLLEEKPMMTKMATNAVLAGTGDIIAQAIEGNGAFVLSRFFTLISVNVLYVVPILTLWYALNEFLANQLELAAGWKRTGFQLAFDQLINAPLVVLGFFCSFQLATAISESLANGAPFAFGAVGQAILSQLKSSYFSTVIANWKIWVLPQLINFAFVPPIARVGFANCVNLVWNVVLSLIANAQRSGPA